MRRVLTQAVAGNLALRFGIRWDFKQLKTSQLTAVASGKQPKPLPNLIHEFSCVVPIRNVPLTQQFTFQGKQQLKRCYSFVDANGQQVLIHRGAKLLRRTDKAGTSSAPAKTDKNLDVWDSSLCSLTFGNANPHTSSTFCTPCGSNCEDLVVVALDYKQPSCDVVFGVPWDPAEFIDKVCEVGHPQNIVLGLSAEVKEASEKIATLPSDQVVMSRGKLLGKYVAAARELQVRKSEEFCNNAG